MESNKRAGNMTAGDRAMIVELAEKYWHKVANKRSDASTVREKAEAWLQMADEFNAGSTVKRTAQQLKQVLQNCQAGVLLLNFKDFTLNIKYWD